MSSERHFKVRISEEVLAQEVSGETVLLDITSEQYFGLNDVGTRIWQLIGGGLNRKEILDVMLREFDVDQSQLEGDLDEIISRLLDAGLVTIDSPNTSNARDK